MKHLQWRMQFEAPFGGVPGTSPVVIAYEEAKPLRNKPRDVVHQIHLCPTPGRHHLVPWMDRLMGEHGWALRNLYTVRTLMQPGARSITRSARACKRCGRYAGLRVPMCGNCQVGTERIVGQWDRKGLTRVDPIDRRRVFEMDLKSPHKRRFVEVLLADTGAPFWVRVTGEESALERLSDQMKRVMHGPGSLAVTHEVLEVLNPGIVSEAPLQQISQALEQWSATRVSEIERSDDDNGFLDEEDEEVLLVADDRVLPTGFDWRDNAGASVHLQQTWDCLEMKPGPPVVIDTDVETAYLRPGGRSRQILPFLEAGSTIVARLCGSAAQRRETVRTLEWYGLRHDARGLGTAVSVYGKRRWKRTMEKITGNGGVR